MIPRRVIYRLVVVVLSILLLFGGQRSAAAQAGDSFTFANGHTISGEFYKFYYSAKDPERLFGLPITVVFDDRQPTGKRIQYFERARMELDAAGKQISLAKLGEFAYDPAQPGLPAPLQPNDPQCQTFSNGKLVCFSFREFYQRYEGEKYLGLPVTNAIFTTEGRLVQYFENARIEWRGELPPGQRVVISALGQFDFDKRVGDQRLRRPAPGNILGAAPSIIPSLHAFSGRPLVANGDRQQVFALIYDQYGKAIKGVPVTVTFFSPDTSPNGSGISGLTTNDAGIAVAEYEVSKVQPNQVILVLVEAQVNGTRLTAKTWFRVWW